MDPDEVFNRFNEIIGPNFSLITGRIPDHRQTGYYSGDDAGSEICCREELAGIASETLSPLNPGKSNKESGKGVAGDEKLLFRKKVAENIHWKLFRPKELVYIKRNHGLWTKVADEECILVTGIEERVVGSSDDNDDSDGNGDSERKPAWILTYVRACHNGHRFGLTKHSIGIGSPSQENVNLTAEDLGVVPIRLLPPAERQEIQARLISRGKIYRRICERPHILMQHEGPVIPLGQGTDWIWMTNQRVVVDMIAERKMRGNRDNTGIIASHVHLGQSLNAFLSTKAHSKPYSSDCSLSGDGNTISNDDVSGIKGKQKSQEYEKTVEHHEWTDTDYLTCPTTLVAFLLDENVWANVNVEHLTEIVWPEDPFDALELETGKKRLMRNLTRRFKMKETNEGSSLDTGEGNGGNLIILLTGPPGVGKTLTAEVVAKETRRPLYRISTGELSDDPSDLKKQLGDIFLLARRWGAIILIDEAGMFMTKRQTSTPAQNAAVTAFLRLFHTYDGMLFLTSTSEDIDTAFYDRIHVTIKYVGLDETQRTNIWRRQLQRAVGSPEEHSPSSRWPDETYRLLGKVETNGRDIRNIVRTAKQLALGLSTELAMKHVVAAMRNFGGSDDNVGSICEKLEALEEKVGGDREQACDDDVKVSPTLNQ